ncbi:hypothetical protein [Mesorhizobium sp. YR577]|uniref:hypothetical protein n=1 Tax=Mesorhizobium sp. YR577 TaxID=1884373 RepID=UPI000B808A49|nr:hypothetical protein [Mesorhizobium sp. YR577]
MSMPAHTAAIRSFRCLGLLANGHLALLLMQSNVVPRRSEDLALPLINLGDIEFLTVSIREGASMAEIIVKRSNELIDPQAQMLVTFLKEMGLPSENIIADIN